VTFLSRVWTTLAECKSPADYYRLHLSIQQFATPDEVALIARSSTALPPEFDRELRVLASRMTEIRDDIQICRFTQIAENISLYVGTTPGRRLVFAFGGKGVGLFMPTALVLQYLVPEGCDVVILHDPARIGFVSGIFGYSDSFRGLVERLRADIDFGGYESVRVYGISGGGAAALAAGVLLGTPSASCFSGHMPMSSPKRAERPQARVMDALLRDAAPLSTFSCVFGADSAYDVNHAAGMETALRTRQISIPGVSNHNVVWELHKQKKLLTVFRDVGLI